MAFKVGAIIGEARLDTRKWANGANFIKGSLKTVGKSILLFTAAAAAAFAAFVIKSTKEADKFQQSLSNVNTLLKEGQADISGLSRELLMMDSALGTTTELTDGLYQAISAGADPAAEAMDVVADSAMFAKAALTDTATAVDVLTTASNAYGKEVVSSKEASDIFFTTIKQGKITGEELASTIGTSIPLFASMNIPLEELSSGLAAMTKQGVSARKATTQLNAIVSSFLKPSEEMNQLLREQGFESGSAFLEAEGLAGALELLQEATAGDAAEMSKLLPNVRAVRGALALTGTGGEEFTRIMEEMADVTGVTEEAFGKQEKTFETLKNTFNKTQVIVGNVSKFFADDLAGGLTTSLNALNNFLLSAEGFDTIGNILVKGAGTVSVLTEVLKILFESVMEPGKDIVEDVKDFLEKMNEKTGDSVDQFDLLGAAISIVTGMLKLAVVGIGTMINTAGNLITVLTDTGKTVKAFFDALSKKGSWDEFNQQADKTADSILLFGKEIIEDNVKVFDTALDIITEFGKETEKNANSVKEKWIQSTEDMKNKVIDNYTKMTTGTEKSAEEGGERSADSFQNGFFKGMSDLGRIARKGFDKAGLEFDNSGEEMGESFGEKFKKAAAKAMETFNKSVKPVLEKVAFVGGQISDAFNSVFDSITLGMQNQLAKIQADGDAKLAVLEQQKEDRLSLTEDEFAQQEETLLEKREADLISQEEFDLAKASLEQQKADNTAAIEKEMDDKIAAQKKATREKENAQKKKMFEAQKANQIANIWIQYALGLVGLWSQSIAQMGPMAGSIMAGIMTTVLTGVAIANTVLISQQSYIPERRFGGMASGLTRINEAGGEIVSLPDGSQVIPNDISSQIAANAGDGMGRETNVHFHKVIVRNDKDIDMIVKKINRAQGRLLKGRG